MPNVNAEAISLIKEFEGFRAKAYPDPATGGDPWTIGYGTTATAGVGIIPVRGMIITESEAEWYLQKAVDKFAAQIAPLVAAPINENEFGAFVSLAYNIGPSAFSKSSALRRFNAGDKRGAADAILMWNKAGGKTMKGLQRRRKAERALFLTPAHLPASGVKVITEIPPRTPEASPIETTDPDPQPSLWRIILTILGITKG